MTSRLLPRDEWHKLNGTEAESVWPLWNDGVAVVVVEHDGQIVGCHALQMVLHAECLWIHPDHRKKAAVARRLWNAVKFIARDLFGAHGYMTAAVSEEVKQLLAHLNATHVAADHYVVDLTRS
jgi:hypothetical protein